MREMNSIHMLRNKKVYKYKGEPFGYGSLGMKNVGEGIESFILNILNITSFYVLK